MIYFPVVARFLLRFLNVEDLANFVNPVWEIRPYKSHRIPVDADC